jgi:3-oxoacyl-[acyl-carrier protein] reductase
MPRDEVLRDKVALVTGGGQPLADAVALRFAAAGARIALVNLPGDAEAARRSAESLAPALALECDPADPEAVRGAVRRVVAELGTLDVLVNAATERSGAASHALSDEAWRRVVAVELSGTLYFCREAIRPMLKQRRGRILNLTDVAGLRGEAGHANHAAARAGVAAMTRALASELAPLGIHVNALSVAYLEHELPELEESARARLIGNTPLGRSAAAGEVAEAALFLASGAASFTTGHLLAVNGGLYL